MNTHFPGLNSFDRRALELDVDYTFAWIKSSPSVFTEELLDRIKFCARNLKKVAGIQQTKALEALAESVSFSTWHELLNHLNMANSFGSEGQRSVDPQTPNSTRAHHQGEALLALRARAGRSDAELCQQPG